MTIKRLSSATLQLPSTVGTLYTVPSGKRAYVTITLHNTNTGAEATQLFWPGAASTQRRFAETINAAQTLMVEPKVMTVLEAGETISGFSTTAGKVNLEITGSEETA